MPYPNDLLSASAYPEVTNARATGDYFHSQNQWAVGATSLFYWAIGILPFKVTIFKVQGGDRMYVICQYMDTYA